MVYDYRQAGLTAADRVLCDFAVKLTLIPGRMSEDDVQQLRDHGWSDEQITVATQVIAYFNYINRVADGLGVDPEPWMTLPEEQWRQRKGHSYG